MTRKQVSIEKTSAVHLSSQHTTANTTGQNLAEVAASSASFKTRSSAEMEQLIVTLTHDLKDINRFYNLSISWPRLRWIDEVLKQAKIALNKLHFEHLDQASQVDWLLLRGFVDRELQELEFQEAKLEKMSPLLTDYCDMIESFCDDRQHVVERDWQDTASNLAAAATEVKSLDARIRAKDIQWPHGPSLADQATKIMLELQQGLDEAFKFYDGYHPLATWWLKSPVQALTVQLEQLQATIKEVLVGTSSADAIIGCPVGRDELMADLQSEFIAYTPEELISIGEQEYTWCEMQMKLAAQALNFGDDWKKALEHVKTMFVEPGQQPLLVQRLAREATDYVRARDMVTIPLICECTRPTYMISPDRQKVSPFFLGGSSILISYPTNSMEHEAKMMSMRGNSVPLSKATVFHELIPGHHLQFYHIARHHQYRSALFDTPFWMEGWAMYWELLFWERGDFFTSPEERIGTLFWRMHRCARIIFSIKFHLGQMSAQDCVDYLVEKVGHERATAEGEVRRSFNGDYRPLYQAGYYLGALQLRQLRREIVDQGFMNEKDFHDRILWENEMPIDMLRALLTNKPLTRAYQAHWRFYDKNWHSDVTG